jgi:hypothetical protein
MERERLVEDEGILVITKNSCRKKEKDDRRVRNYKVNDG